MKTPKSTGDPRVDAAIRDTVRDLPRIVDCGRVDVVTAGEPIVVSHTLGRVPDFIVPNPWQDFNVFFSETLQGQWTDSSVVVVASAAGTFTLFVGVL